MKAATAIRCLYVIVATVALAGCGGGQAVAPLGRTTKHALKTAPKPEPRAAQLHPVIKGESLYAIAWAYNLDYRDIAAWNQIPEPYTIYPGQRLLLGPPTQQASAKKKIVSVLPISRNSPRVVALPAPKSVAITQPKVPAKTVKRAKKSVEKKPIPYVGETVKKWRWPAKGKLSGSFGKSGGKGINIQGQRGQPIYTAAPGRVVYSGSGLRGYGKLIIIKHNKRFLSAYAHNQRLQVREGDNVNNGQQIAEMGNTESREIKLHFEIRRDGKPVNPKQYLP